MEVVFLLDNCERIKAKKIEDIPVNGKNDRKVKEMIWEIIHKEVGWVKVEDQNGFEHYIFVNKICDIIIKE